MYHRLRDMAFAIGTLQIPNKTGKKISIQIDKIWGLMGTTKGKNDDNNLFISSKLLR